MLKPLTDIKTSHMGNGNTANWRGMPYPNKRDLGSRDEPWETEPEILAVVVLENAGWHVEV